MKDEREPLSILLHEIQQAEQKRIRKNREAEVEKLEAALSAIVACADKYAPEMARRPYEEFLVHAGTIRREAATLLEECGKVSDSNPDVLIRIKEQFEELKAFVEYWFTLCEPEAVESVHLAL